ncbi:MAG: MobP3 family relaxase [Porcipelethomonas sp.]
MPKYQIIVTSRYLKSGTQKSKNKRRNYTKYIATRETVEFRDQNTIDRNDNATKNQQELLCDLLSDFPEAKRYLEYEDYIADPTMENASELISTIIERNADVIGDRQNFVGYMAMRPGVQKRGSHGLFNESDEPIVLDRVANEIANHKGNVWSHVVSLRREDAVRLGYDNSEVWRDLVKRHIADIARAQRIPLCNLKWYAAFHDTTHHPHIHLLVYSTNPKQGFLTKEGIDKIRSAFANDIFHDDLQSIYQEQTISRDELKAVSKTEFENIVDNIRQGNFDCPLLEDLVRKLYSQLQNVRGKKVYGYLPPEVKQTVNDIFSELARDENIRQLYEKWCDLERLKYKTYTQKEKELPALTENKVFQQVRNMIIRTVLDMDSPMVDAVVQVPELIVPNTYDSDVEISQLVDESDQSAEEGTVTINTADFVSDSKYYLKWSNNFKEACKLIYDKNSKFEDFQKAEQLLLLESQTGNVLAVHDLGKLYSTDKLCEIDLEKSQRYYTEALKGFLEIELTAYKLKSYLQYRIGKMYCYGLGTEQDYSQAFEWFLKAAKDNNKFAQFSLANLYYYGNGVDKDLSQAFLWYQKSASQGQPYASYAVAQMYSKGEYVSKDDNTAQQYYKQALSGFLNLKRKGQADDNLFYKIGMMYKNGLGTDIDISKAIECFQRSAENKWSSYQLGKLYLLGADGLEKDKEKAIRWLTKSADDGNEYAQKLLDDIDKFENAVLADTIFGLFINMSRCIKDDYSQKYKSFVPTVDSKLREVILRKKQNLGIKNSSSDMEQKNL